MAPDAHTMGLISRAAYEVDDYWRIVEVLHRRLVRFDRKGWRASYKALTLLEHLLTHGPGRVAEEFDDDRDVIREMTSFQHVDEKGFNWGLNMRKKSETVLKLLEDEPFLKEERARARKLTIGIKGFGSFSQRSSKSGRSLKELQGAYERSNSHFIHSGEHSDREVSFSAEERICKTQPRSEAEKPFQNPSIGEACSVEVDHPFCENELQSRASLLS
ncbi:hypothetical protein NMG60_11018506 [Bertholletia excelsa]